MAIRPGRGGPYAPEGGDGAVAMSNGGAHTEMLGLLGRV